MVPTRQNSKRIAAAENHRLLREILRRRPYAGSSREYEAIAWKEVKTALYGKSGASSNVEEQYEQLYAAWRNDPDPGSKLDSTTQQLLRDIQRDSTSCSFVRQSVRQPAQPPSTTEAAAGLAPADAAAASSTAQPTTRAPQTPSPAEAHATATPEAPASKPRAKPRAKRTKKTTNDEPAAKRPRGRPRTTRAREAPVETVETPIDDGREAEIPVGPNGSAVDASPDSRDGGLVRMNGTAQFSLDMIRAAIDWLAVGERETKVIGEVLNGVLESQRERQRYAAQAVADAVQHR